MLNPTAFLTPAPPPHHAASRGRTASRRQLPVCASTQKPSRVAIAGAGIAGLATALALLKTPGTGVREVTVFEPRETADLGQGAALNINGAAAILLQYGVPLWDIANPMNSVIARSVSGEPLFTLDVKEALATSALARNRLVVDGRPAFMTVMRDQLQVMLIDALGDSVDLRRGKGNRVTGVVCTASGASFVLANGTTTEQYDLVVGADGLRSNVRSYVAGELRPPRYTRLRVQWAITPPGPSALPRGTLEQWFGDGCYVLRYVAGVADTATEMLAISFQDNAAASENVGYMETDLREQVAARLERAGVPDQVMAVFRRAERFIETGVYEHDILPKWSRSGTCTLVGDSAHAMPPHLGQGANQAVQDARALALALSQIGREHADLSTALAKYEAIRKIPVGAILQTSRLVGLIETQGGFLGTLFRDNLFRFMGITGAVGRAFLQAATPRVG